MQPLFKYLKIKYTNFIFFKLPKLYKLDSNISKTAH